MFGNSRPLQAKSFNLYYFVKQQYLLIFIREIYIKSDMELSPPHCLPVRHTLKNVQIGQPRVQFNLTDNDLSCFISKLPKPRSAHKKVFRKDISPKPLFQLLQEKTFMKERHCPYFDFGFQNKILFNPELSQEIEYEDRQLNENQRQTGSQEDQIAQQVVSQCIRVLTEETMDNSMSDSTTSVFLQNSFTDKNSDKRQNLQYINNIRKSKNLGQDIQFSVKLNKTIQDGRTTLMLRNIPNKYTQQMIFQELERAGLGDKYDFFYLPIDYKNQCNVGYAFINLVDVIYVSELYKAFHDRKWRKFNSQKICQVCYARIQGTSQLVNHFRYSNIMQRDNRMRPVINMRMQQSADAASSLQSARSSSFPN